VSYIPENLRFPVRGVSWAPLGTFYPDEPGKWVKVLYQESFEINDFIEDKKSFWFYEPGDDRIRNEILGKCVYLKHIDYVYKIQRLIVSLESNEILNANSMIAALNMASKYCFEVSLEKMLKKHKNNKINWEFIKKQQ
jgi:hypothetical protein